METKLALISPGKGLRPAQTHPPDPPGWASSLPAFHLYSREAACLPLLPSSTPPQQAACLPLLPSSASPQQAACLPLLPSSASPQQAACLPLLPSSASPQQAAC